MDNKYFKIEKNELKKKKFIFTPFVKVLNSGFIDGNFREYLYADFISKYLKFKDFNTFYAPCFDSFTFNSFIESKIEFNELNDNLSSKYLKELDTLGVNYDEDKVCNFRDKNTIKNLQKIFLYFYDKGLIKYVNRNVYTNYDKSKIYDGIETDDKIKEMNLDCFVLDIEKFSEKFVSNVNKLLISDDIKQELIRKLDEKKTLTINFHCDNNYSFEFEVENPECLGSLCGLVLNPNYVDILDFIAPSEIFAVENFIFKKHSRYLETGVKLTNPLTGKKVPIFLSFLHNEGMKFVYNDDIEIIDELKLDFIRILDYNRLINSDFLDGYTIEAAHDLIIKVFSEEGIGRINTHYKKKNILITSKDKYGMPFPLMHAADDIITLENHLPIHFSSQFRRIIPKESEIDSSYHLYDETLNSLFMRGVSVILEILNDNKIILDDILSKDNISLINKWLIKPLIIVNKNYIVHDLFMPILFLTIIEQLEDVKLINNFELIFSESVYDLYGNKITKDSNNCLKLEELFSIYGADAIRMYILRSNINEKFYFDSDQVFKYKQFLTEVKMFYDKDFVENTLDLDFLFYKFKNKIYDYLVSYDSKAIIDLIMDFFSTIKDKKISKKQGLDFLIVLYLICPKFALNIYRTSFKKENILDCEWPI